MPMASTQREITDRITTMTNDYEVFKGAYTAQNVSTAVVSDYMSTLSSQPGYQGYSYGNYPVYVDRTQKAFAIAKWLMDSKLIKVASVPEFITLIDGLARRV